ncbi:Alcohol dehydrogenase zinc-binding domain protein [Frankia canadensis]|uniref:Alcohol dehydrogenase zinc-binding domain protein n=1 Tax=Frankia canadensis TaxID=1836972 RepID=A0A2I2L1C5_9ACTN|nr:NADP-dependent oxidoreductase [Frankia canadensis]SNQ51733.1 Alcohol dehydrogenase zinc-binding domain protein [Frankia canadensis]SOU59023.1 Alcohol dehydrogenase zinc-binding domain protein [Frankia canadensis]
MRAISQTAFGGPDVLRLIEADPPVPGPGEVQIKVSAAGVNPADWKARAGLLDLPMAHPFILGLDLAGVVTATGADVTRFSTADRVYGFTAPPRGSYAELAVARQEALAPAGELDPLVAAALPIAGLTAWQPLVRVGAVRPGQRILVHAAAGGVGHLAVQIAKQRGAYVIGTARPDKHEFLRALGADELIDYTRVDFAAVLSDVDMVIDPMAEDYGPRSLDVLAPTGVLVDVRGRGPDRTEVRTLAARRGLRYVRFGVERSGDDLRQLTDLVTRGALRVEITRTLPLAEAARAHELLETGRVRGKIVLCGW